MSAPIIIKDILKPVLSIPEEVPLIKNHFAKSVQRVLSGPCFPTFGLKTETYCCVFSPNVEKCGPEKLRIWTLFTQRIQ